MVCFGKDNHLYLNCLVLSRPKYQLTEMSAYLSLRGKVNVMVFMFGVLHWKVKMIALK